MSDLPTKAVFFSYASQDAEAAKRICDALRVAGVEVWFDQSELVGGDAWDAKIRKQIGSCALFIPIISASTQARREGYFRIEWKLAAQRTHAIAGGTPFLLPAVIDHTAEQEALVPAEFREVQWTRLIEQPTIDAFCVHVAGVLEDSTRVTPVSACAPSAPVRTTPGRRWQVIIGLGIVVGTGFWWWFAGRSATGHETSARANEAAAELDARFTALLRNSREDAALAEALTEKQTNENPESARAWSNRAFVQSVYLTRGWDNTERRRQDAQRFAQRALVLDAKDTRAMAVLASVFAHQGAFNEAENILRRALQLRPGWAPLTVMLAAALSGQGKTDQAIDMMEDLVRRNAPGDRGGYYNLALLHECKEVPDFEAALRCFEAAMSAEPPANILLHKAALLAGARGDLAGARATLELVPAIDRIEDRPVGTAMTLGLLERQPARVIAAAGQTARDFFDDLYVHGPKAWRLAQAHRLEGKDALARQEWQNAETVLRQRLAAGPANPVESAALAVTLAWLGRAEEAATIMAPIEAHVKESPPRVVGWAPDHLRLLYLGYYYAGMGDASNAVPYLRRLLNRRELLTDHTLPLDPWWDKLRGQPEFETLLAESVARRAGSKTVGAAAMGNVPADKSVAVLAFTNLSSDKEQEYFSDGISEELLNVLAKVPGLKVSARTSAFYFKGKEVPIPEIAKQLGVAYVVEGSVRKQGDKVRITAQLIKAADGFHVWSENYDRDLKDIFAIQSDVAERVATVLKVRVMGTVRASTANMAAYQLYQTGRFWWNRRNKAGLEQAIRTFEQVIALDPAYAEAYSGLSAAYAIAPTYLGMSVPDSLSKTRAAAQKALELDPGLAEPHAALGSCLESEFDWNGAETEYRRAISLNPNHSTAYHWLSMMLVRRGRLDEALREVQWAGMLDPLSLIIKATVVWTHIAAGDYDQAIALGRAAVAQNPDFTVLHVDLGNAYLARHMIPDALAAFRKVRELNPDYPIGLGGLGYALALSGDRAGAMAILQEIDVWRRKGLGVEMEAADVHLGLGDMDRTFEHLERAWAGQEGRLSDLPAEPRWKELLQEVRGQALLRKMNLLP